MSCSGPFPHLQCYHTLSAARHNILMSAKLPCTVCTTWSQQTCNFHCHSSILGGKSIQVRLSCFNLYMYVNYVVFRSFRMSLDSINTTAGYTALTRHINVRRTMMHDSDAYHLVLRNSRVSDLWAIATRSLYLCKIFFLNIQFKTDCVMLGSVHTFKPSRRYGTLHGVDTTRCVARNHLTARCRLSDQYWTTGVCLAASRALLNVNSHQVVHCGLTRPLSHPFRTFLILFHSFLDVHYIVSRSYTRVLYDVVQNRLVVSFLLEYKYR